MKIKLIFYILAALCLQFIEAREGASGESKPYRLSSKKEAELKKNKFSEGEPQPSQQEKNILRTKNRPKGKSRFSVEKNQSSEAEEDKALSGKRGQEAKSRDLSQKSSSSKSDTGVIGEKNKTKRKNKSSGRKSESSKPASGAGAGKSGPKDKSRLSRPKSQALKGREAKSLPAKAEAKSQDSKSAPPQPSTFSPMNIQDKIEETFKGFLNIIEAHSRESKEYRKAVLFLEKTFYDEISFDSLKLLSDLYLEKEDIKGHLRVAKAISISYPNKAESFYLLAKAYEALSQTIEDEEELESNRKKMLENYRRALKLNPKHKPAYEAFLKELMVLDEESQELKHTRESLNLVMDMLKHLREKQYYILLCEAYFDNNFIRQTQKACVKSIKKNPNEPISMMTLAFSLPDEKKRNEKLIEIGSKYPNSFKTQYKIGLYFKESFPERAIVYLTNASKIQPEHLRLNETLSRLLLRNNQEESAYSYFLKTCLLSEGVFLTEFKSALGFLRRKKKIELAIKYDKGAQECFQVIREMKKNKKK